MIVETKKGKFPVRYGWSALAKFGDLAGLKMDDVLELDLSKMSLSDMLNFIYVGFRDGARKEGEECAFQSIDEVGDLLDEDPDVMEKVMGAFGEMSKAKEAEAGKKK